MKNTDPISQEVFERIERYHVGAMRPDEQLLFEKELAESSVLSAQFRKVEAILNGIEEIAFRDNMEAFHQEWDESRQAGKKVIAWVFHWPLLHLLYYWLVFLLGCF